MSDPAENPSVRRRKVSFRISVPAEFIAAAGVLALIVLVCLAYFWMSAQWMNGASQKNTPSFQQAEAMVQRCGQVNGSEQASHGWINRMAAGMADPADYLMRFFTSAAYLSSRPDDRTFISDAGWVLDGNVLDSQALEKAETTLNTLGSRLAYINELVRKAGIGGRIDLPAEPTRLRTFNLATDLPSADSEVVGLLAITSEVRLTGGDALFKIYSDGLYRRSQSVDSRDPTVQNVYKVDWDTRTEEPGRHHLAMMILTSDGRGEWIDINPYNIPAVVSLKAGKIQAGELTGGTAWYELPIVNGRALLLALDAGQPLEMAMYDQRTRQLGLTTGTAGRPAALRAQISNVEMQETVFVRIRAAAAGESAQPVRYQLVPALAAARPENEPEQMLAVLAIKDNQLQIQDRDGKISWQPLSDYQLIDPTARLSDLGLILPDGQKAGLAPVFDPEILEYGLYADAGTAQAQLVAEAMEGSGARLSIKNQTDQDNEKTRQEILPGGALPLQPSKNELTITVTGFDDSIREYVIHILRSPAGDGYHQTLELFPFSYRSALWLLHVRRPAWQFVTGSAGLPWQPFIDAEDAAGLSLVNENDSPPAWIEPDSPVYDGSAWKAAARPVIEYFADPRNFLDEINIFQFERLTYLPAVQTKEGIEAIIRDSFMAAGNAQGIDYAGLLLQAGEQAGISPYFLAAKIIQEMGRQGESPLATGSLSGYEGVYNFYNIGATPDPDIPNGARINGARFALYGREPGLGEITEEEKAWLLPWTTPQKAIIGGAIWIAERYIGIGQDTLYLQKFDLLEEGGLYIHQYAQNIQMAWSEGRRSRKAYSELDLLDRPFVFEIPVFLEMPEQPASLP